MESVRFNRWYGPYQKGDIAGFPAETAAAFVAAGYAEKVTHDTDKTKRPELTERKNAADRMVKK